MGAPWLYSACGRREYCLSAWQTVCPDAQVCAVDIDDGTLAHATRLGADAVVNAATEGDAAAAVTRATSGGAHGVLTTAPSLSAVTQGLGMTRRRGTCVLVGLPPGAFPVPLFDVGARRITIRGSFDGTRHDLAEALAFAAAGQVKADIALQPLAPINEVFTRLEHGDVPSRVVLDFGGRSSHHHPRGTPCTASASGSTPNAPSSCPSRRDRRRPRSWTRMWRAILAIPVSRTAVARSAMSSVTASTSIATTTM